MSRRSRMICSSCGGRASEMARLTGWAWLDGGTWVDDLCSVVGRESVPMGTHCLVNR